ncbi:unnamed protein product [Vitrella brassicaformis CCMP3155]|uniref:protein disulfide-isomerase n=1 Tax=Vitrella brassicaformis (strain CCMP3155) TaxID=1169540 RepID=A0A0G4EDW7_VITBC|nr:unnamed protein product [Vitrella brassicaformis CCMP3155]|eukprot:CEL93939.1 unnamed protein product [Vitrella brassicaformis CCMP3155]
MLSLLVVLGAFASAVASDVAILTNDNFTSYVDGSKNVFVKFYAPWCGHCKRMAPAWEEVAATFKDEDDVVIAKVDSTVERELSDKYEVRGYPTLKFFPKGKTESEPYDGGREADPMVEFVNQKAGTFRKKGGDLKEEAGKITALEPLIKEYAQCAKGKKECFDGAMKKVDDEIAKQKPSMEKVAKFYKKMLDKMGTDPKEGLKEWKKELERLTKIGAGSMAADKKTWVTQRKNVLTYMVSIADTEGDKDEL